MPKPSAGSVNDLYEPDVEIAPRAPVPPLAKSTAYQPLCNSNRGDLAVARSKFKAASKKALSGMHDRIAKSVQDRH